MQTRLISDVGVVLFHTYLDLWMDWANVEDKSDYVRSYRYGYYPTKEIKIDETTYNRKINGILLHCYLWVENYDSQEFRVQALLGVVHIVRIARECD